MWTYRGLADLRGGLCAGSHAGRACDLELECVRQFPDDSVLRCAVLLRGGQDAESLLEVADGFVDVLLVKRHGAQTLQHLPLCVSVTCM
jgi:hypothetical protein